MLLVLLRMHGQYLQAWLRVVATCKAVQLAQHQARQAHLQDIAATFHQLFRQHSILQTWHSMAQHAKQEQAQMQQATAQQQLEQAQTGAAVKFQTLYAMHSCWKAWLHEVQQSRAAQQLEQQHEARQRGIQRFLQVCAHLLCHITLCTHVHAADVI